MLIVPKAFYGASDERSPYLTRRSSKQKRTAFLDEDFFWVSSLRDYLEGWESERQMRTHGRAEEHNGQELYNFS